MSAGITVFLTGSASADPSASAWRALRQCESTNNYAINTGNGYYGAYQFDLSTWRSVGGSGSPADASPAEQDYRALYLYRMRGWSPWTCASIAGLREDSSARSGVVPTRADSAYIGGGGSPAPAPAPKPAPTPTPTLNCRLGSSTAPAWGGTTFTEGHTYRALSCWQKQMATRGYHFTGTGYFGTNTLAAVHDLQRKSGIKQSNAIDSRTWTAAWSKVSAAPKPRDPDTRTQAGERHVARIDGCRLPRRGRQGTGLARGVVQPRRLRPEPRLLADADGEAGISADRGRLLRRQHAGGGEGHPGPQWSRG